MNTLWFLFRVMHGLKKTLGADILHIGRSVNRGGNKIRVFPHMTVLFYRKQLPPVADAIPKGSDDRIKKKED